MRVEAKANLRNRMVKSELKTVAKKFKAAVDAGNKEAALVLYKEYTGSLDKAALKGTLHSNNVNRKKAQISKAMAGITA
jgi:small subunit ribosomal protein S20